MFKEFLECTEEKDGLETVTIVCGDCIMRVTLVELRKYLGTSKRYKCLHCKKIIRDVNVLWKRDNKPYCSHCRGELVRVQ